MQAFKKYEKKISVRLYCICLGDLEFPIFNEWSSLMSNDVKNDHFDNIIHELVNSF